MKAFCEYNEYEIAGEYEDAGKSGKSIEGRLAFNRMIEDIWYILFCYLPMFGIIIVFKRYRPIPGKNFILKNYVV